MGPICTRIRSVIRSRVDLGLPLDGRELRAVAQAFEDMAWQHYRARVGERYVYAELSDDAVMDERVREMDTRRLLALAADTCRRQAA